MLDNNNIIKSYYFVTEPDTLNRYQTCGDASNYERTRKRAKSLFVIAPTAPTDNFNNNFTEQVKEYNAKEPFYFVTSNYLKPYYYETVSMFKTVLKMDYDTVDNIILFNPNLNLGLTLIFLSVLWCSKHTFT